MTINPRNRAREVLAVGPTVAIDLTIANNAALSEAFDMSDYCMGTVIVSGTWTAANIGFKICDTLGGTYVIANDKTGVPIQISGVQTGEADGYAIPIEMFANKFVKLWSKNSTAATRTDINQAGARAMKVILK
jgi:hypothetical protein